MMTYKTEEQIEKACGKLFEKTKKLKEILNVGNDKKRSWKRSLEKASKPLEKSKKVSGLDETLQDVLLQLKLSEGQKLLATVYDLLSDLVDAAYNFGFEELAGEGEALAEDLDDLLSLVYALRKLKNSSNWRKFKIALKNYNNQRSGNARKIIRSSLATVRAFLEYDVKGLKVEIQKWVKDLLKQLEDESEYSSEYSGDIIEVQRRSRCSGTNVSSRTNKKYSDNSVSLGKAAAVAGGVLLGGALLGRLGRGLGIHIHGPGYGPPQPPDHGPPPHHHGPPPPHGHGRQRW